MFTATYYKVLLRYNFKQLHRFCVEHINFVKYNPKKIPHTHHSLTRYLKLQDYSETRLENNV